MIHSIHSKFERVGIGLDFKAQAGLFPHPSLRELVTPHTTAIHFHLARTEVS